jgi:LysM repeat protein
MERLRRSVGIVFLVITLVSAASWPALAAPGMSPERQDSTIHIVQWGENLTMIARCYGVTTTAIVEANCLTNPNYIYAGQRLIIPLGAVPAPPIQPPIETGTYVVQRGDTLTSIGARHGTTVNELVALNGLWNPNLIYVGQVLKIPGGAPAPSPPIADVCIYWVKPGDTLTRIALQYGSTVWAIAIANNLANPSFIYVGQELIIPNCTTGAATPTPTTCPPGPTPTPTSTPVATGYQYTLVRQPDKDACHPGFCIPEVSGWVNETSGNRLSNMTPAWIKLESERQGIMYCRTGDPGQVLQEGVFKFVSKNGDLFGWYTLTVVRGDGDPMPFSPTYHFKMNSFVAGGQQSNIVFQHN